ncbi:MAG: hypothetical protein L3J43_00170 [Sulfurovum sp.]|nr:hypothetical protein [Sulfurovum sp.]
MKYFSDIELGEKERISEEITEDIHNRIVGVYEKYAVKNCFSESAPVDCPDGIPGICGFNNVKFLNLAKGEIPNFDIVYPKSIWEDGSDKSYDQYTTLDFIQFCYKNIKKAIKSERIPYDNGYNSDTSYATSYTFEESDSEKKAFRNDINTLFRRNGLVFELQEDGKIVRTIPQALQPLVSKIYLTGDDELNSLVEKACDNFLKPKIEDRQIALEKIWDAFERMKTYYQEKNKKESITELIKEVSSTNSEYMKLLNDEAVALTNIGNDFRIRHHETDKNNIIDNNQIDYFFYRIVSFMQLFLKHLEKK